MLINKDFYIFEIESLSINIFTKYQLLYNFIGSVVLGDGW